MDAVEGKTTVGELFLKLHGKYGTVVAVRISHRPIVSLADPKAIKDILMNPEWEKPPMRYRFAAKLFGERFSGYGLVNESNHARWARNRRVFNPAFHRKYLAELMDTFNNSADRLRYFVAAKADGTTEVNMKEATKRVTLDIIAKTGFSMGQDMLCHDLGSLFDALNIGLEAVVKAQFDPLLEYSPFKSAREYREKTRQSIRYLRAQGDTLIRQRLEDLRAGKTMPKDILSHIIETAMVDENIQLAEMTDEFVTFFTAGHETVASLLQFTLIAVGQHPQVKKKLIEEVDSVVGDNDKLLYEDLAKLVYMELFLIYVMGMQETYFKDPLTFNPERFRQKDDKMLYAYLPFSLGPRSCIGQHFAMMEAKVVLTKLIQNFKMDFVPGQKLGYATSIALKPTNDCLHYVTPRVQKQ